MLYIKGVKLNSEKIQKFLVVDLELDKGEEGKVRNQLIRYEQFKHKIDTTHPLSTCNLK
jgi:hypothetical protein